MDGKWNEAKIRRLLNDNDKAVERAIVAIYERQTSDEKVTSDAKYHNRRGFSAAHAKRGSYYGRWVKSGRSLTGFHLVKAREIVLHYVSQLLDVAKSSQRAPVPSKRSPLTFEQEVVEYMRRYGESREEAERVVKNVRDGKCPDGCCGGGEY